MITRLTSLSKNIVQFGRFLRLKGFVIGVEEEAMALQALQHIDYSSDKIFRLLLKSTLCRRKSQLDEFDNLFFEYWKHLDKAVDAKTKGDPGKEKRPGTPGKQFKSLKTWLQGNKNNDREETAVYSTQENLSQKDFSSVPDDEIDELMRCIRAMSKRMAAKVNRRFEFSHKPAIPDLRQTLRKNLRNGGELLDIIHRKPKRNRVKLLVLCDVSKSMELYTAFLIQFLYAFQQVYNRIETFVFSTFLTRITTLLKQKNYQEVLLALNTGQSGWSGGTRIGESLNTFVNEYGNQLLSPRTIVIILSDGWDTGKIDLLQKNMEIIHVKSKKVIWMNPLSGYSSYRPDVAGMQAALPYIDVFTPAYNAESLRRLGRWL